MPLLVSRAACGLPPLPDQACAGSLDTLGEDRSRAAVDAGGSLRRRLATRVDLRRRRRAPRKAGHTRRVLPGWLANPGASTATRKACAAVDLGIARESLSRCAFLAEIGSDLLARGHCSSVDAGIDGLLGLAAARGSQCGR